MKEEEWVETSKCEANQQREQVHSGDTDDSINGLLDGSVEREDVRFPLDAEDRAVIADST